MDTDTIDRLEAGRELDALVAEKVMGWQRVEKGLPYFWPTKEKMDVIKKQHPDVLAVDYFSCPEFSTDIAPAWKVIMKMIVGTAYECYLSHQTDGWDCLFTAPVGPEGHAANLPAPHAICLAALKVVNNTNANDH